MKKLTTLQECINDAQREPRSTAKIPMEMSAFRAHKLVLDRADDILKNHGISLSSYLRKCCENLVKDYRDGKAR